jgi:signal transduction histidine kinase/CheY-like chemotaxis protein
VGEIRKHPTILAILLCGAIFIVDLFTPLGDAIWVTYTIPLLIVSSQLRKRHLLLITGLSWLLIVLGHFFSPTGPNPAQDALYRGVGMIVQLIMALALVQRNRIREGLEKRRGELEKEVTERTAVEGELRRSQEALLNTLTNERQLQEQLRQSQKMEALGTLAGGIAHDFNNILAAIIGFSEMARDETPEGSPTRRHADRVFNAGIRGRELVQQILMFSRKAQNEKHTLRLSVAVREALMLLRASLPPTIGIREDIQSESGFVLADLTQLQQVVMNLCTNAAHAMGKKGGDILIGLADFSFSSAEHAPDPTMSPGLYMRLTVTDTGEGMSKEVLDRVFDPFFTTKAKGEGTGLGLSVSHGIVASHGGAMTVSSEPGMGSAFSVYLPKYREDRAQGPEDADGLVPGGSERVLLVDDEETVVDMGGEVLTGLGYQVIARTSSRDALALVRMDPSRFDLVITDQAMPELTGIELAKEMLSIRADMPIILCTGFSNVVDADVARQAGIRAFAMKPLTKKEIAKTIREVLDE